MPLVFQGEDMSMTVRGFTYGYDYYTPEKCVCFHIYAMHNYAAKRNEVPQFWEHSNIYEGVPAQSIRRMNTIMGFWDRPLDQWYHEEADKYGVGQIREIEKYYRTFGIDIEAQTVEGYLCRFVGKIMMRYMIPAMRKDHMGVDYDKIVFEYTNPYTETNKELSFQDKKLLKQPASS
jgi:hypothetical protein